MLGANDKTRRTQSISLALDSVLRASDGILDMLPIATFVCDAAGTILQYNQRAVQIWGRAPEPGQTHEEFTAGVRYFDSDGKLLERSGLADVSDVLPGIPGIEFVNFGSEDVVRHKLVQRIVEAYKDHTDERNR